MFKYLIKDGVDFKCGFPLTSYDVVRAIDDTNQHLAQLPASLFRAIDYKTTSSMIGCILCDNISLKSNGQAMVNPIEKGHPDILPYFSYQVTEEELRNYPEGLEVKCTIGGVSKGANLQKASPRLSETTSLTWQAHHQEVSELLGITYDYINTSNGNKPIITAAFYSDNLVPNDWGEISGTTGRNTKVCGMLASGKHKMAAGWFAVIDIPGYIELYERIFRTIF